MTKKTILVPIGVLFILVAVLLYIQFPKIEPISNMPVEREIAHQDDSGDLLQAGVSESQFASDSLEESNFPLFELSNFLIEFGDISGNQEKLDTVILGMEELLNNRSYLEVPLPESRGLTAQVHGSNYSVKSYLDFSPSPNDSSKLNLLAFYSLDSDILEESIGALIEIEGEKSLYVPLALSDFIVEQSLFAEANSDAFEDLDRFVDRLNAIEFESSPRESVLDIMHYGIRNEELDSIDDDTAIEIFQRLPGDYRYANLLNVVPVSVVDDFYAAMPEYENAIIAKLEVKNRDRAVNGDSILALYLEDRWFVWIPTY